MKRSFILLALLAGQFILSPGFASAQDSLWVSAYYAGWLQGSDDSPGLRPDEIDYSAVTHIIHFSISPTTTGGINYTVNGITPEKSMAAVAAAHAAGKKILICVGGAGTSEDFAGATSPKNIEVFIQNLIRFAGERGYDGIDIDWEPLEPKDRFKAFVPQLRRAMNAVNPRWMLTIACAGERVVAEVYSYFDQINLMTYDMSGPWPGWVTWHNSPIFDSGLLFPGTDLPLPSANRRLDEIIALGVPPSRLGFGIDFYGFIWAGGTGTPTGGVTAPNQSWKTPPSVQGNVPYATIMEQYFQPSYQRWDSLAEAAYLSIDKPGSTDDRFISFDNSRTCEQKISFARSKGLGGVIIWELGGGYYRSAVGVPPDELLQAVRRAKQRTARSGRR